MDANEIQHSLTPEQIFTLLEMLDGQPTYANSEEIIARTVCHGGDSHKLYYYDNSKRFTCYTGNCGSGFSIFDLVQFATGVDFITSVHFVVDSLNLVVNSNTDYKSRQLESGFLNKFSQEHTRALQYDVIDKKHLQQFDDMYHISWVKDNISTSAMQQFNIKFNVVANQIIIPHYDSVGNLIGIRVRNLDKQTVERGFKYMPYISGQQDFRHNTGDFLYGLHCNKYNIQNIHKIILFEAEKSVMQYETYFGRENNIAVALSGSNIGNHQLSEIHKMQVDEVIIALDKEYHQYNDEKALFYARQIKANFIDKLRAFCRVSVIWDKDNLLSYKDSPTDKGREVWQQLYDNRIIIK